MTELKKWLAEADENRRLLAQEYLIASVAQQIWAEMEKCGITKSQLAERLGKSRPFVTQVLNGATNLTLRTISDLAHALDCDVDVEIRKHDGDGWQEVPMPNRARIVQFLRPDIACNHSDWTALDTCPFEAEAAAA